MYEKIFYINIFISRDKTNVLQHLFPLTCSFAAVHKTVNARAVEYRNSAQNPANAVCRELSYKLSMNDWAEIVQLVVNYGDEFEKDIENSMDYQPCDQCGNWNHNYIYLKKEKNNE